MQNYPIHSMSNTSRRYERDRHMTPPSQSRAKATMRPVQQALPAPVNHQISRLQVNLTHNKNVRHITTNRISKMPCSCRNMKQFLILTVTFISLANIADEGRIVCDHIHPHRALFDSPSPIYLAPLSPLNYQRSNRIAIPTNEDASNRRSAPLPLSRANQLMLLLAPFMNTNQHQQDGSNRLQKLIPDSTNRLIATISTNNGRNGRLLSGENNHTSHYQYSQQDSGMNSIPVTTTPVTATLMAPNLFQPVTPPPTMPENNHGTKLQQDKDILAPPVSQIVGHMLSNSPYEQSDLSRIMPQQLISPLVFSPSFKDFLNANHFKELYEKHEPVTPLVHILPFPDQDYMMTSGSSPIVAAKSSTSTDKTNTYTGKLRSLVDRNQVQASPSNINLAKPRGALWEMATDPSLMVTLFHMMDRASLALPLGFLLMPFIQMAKRPYGGGLGLNRLIPARATHRSVDYEELAKRIDFVDKLLSKALRPSHRSGSIGK